MYYPNEIEDICYEPTHMEQVVKEIEANFTHYFDLFLETEAGTRISTERFDQLAKALGSAKRVKAAKTRDKGKVFKSIIQEAIEEFEKDRANYMEVLDEEALEEHEDDPLNFKNSVLKNSCPIIRLTLQNKKARELDKYRVEFRRADPNELLSVVTNLTSFANWYIEDYYDEKTYEDIQTLEELNLSVLNESDYCVYGVIGGGIKSHFLYKLYPSVFPNRSRQSLWAFWYLTNKKTFKCIQDSEFLMINHTKNTTHQNYFYPYDLFAFYVFEVYKLLKTQALQHGVYLDPDYRYVFVDSYLSFVAQTHSEEIEYLGTSLEE